MGTVEGGRSWSRLLQEQKLAEGITSGSPWPLLPGREMLVLAKSAHNNFTG